eukprot:1385514-Amorphochlora_amoeboformis.AAC.1
MEAANDTCINRATPSPKSSPYRTGAGTFVGGRGGGCVRGCGRARMLYPVLVLEAQKVSNCHAPGVELSVDLAVQLALKLTLNSIVSVLQAISQAPLGLRGTKNLSKLSIPTLAPKPLSAALGSPPFGLRVPVPVPIREIGGVSDHHGHNYPRPHRYENVADLRHFPGHLPAALCVYIC